MAMTRIKRGRNWIRLIWFVALVVGCYVYYSVQWELQGSLNQHWQEQDSLEESSAMIPISDVTTTTSNITDKKNNNNNNKKDDVDVCFVTCVFGKWASTVDKLQNITKLDWYYNHRNHNHNSTQEYDHFHFFVFTNLPNIKGKGWTKIVKEFPLPYKRFITQSRWPKFLGWKEPQIQQHCQVVFYLDSIGELIATPQDYQDQAKAILRSDIGLAQYLHRGGGGAFGEFRRVEVFHKDTMENIQASKAWLSRQPDFDPNCTLYENRYMGYAINSTLFQKASEFLWDHYSQEVDSWRDQPLWCYVLSHFHMTPIPLDHKRLFTLNTKRMGKHKHRYNDHTNHDAQQAREQKNGTII